VYAGEAGAYLLTDPVEQDMILGTNSAGVNPGLLRVLPGTGIPLVIQDKTFVDNTTIAAQDPTWNWGTNPGAPMTGDLWFPHVYMSAQNPYDDTGVNPYGRWHYGPWFFPPAPAKYGPVANIYFGQPGEPPMTPGTPNPSMATEAFMDTPLVNGAVYPNMTVEPRAYRFRVLNAADDRFFNLQLYVADPTVTTADGRINTEVKMVPAQLTPGFPPDWPTDGREGGVPDPAMMGPSFIQIGTEGGFLPAPVVVENQPITWVRDPTVFNAGNVDLHALLIAPAERADVIVDFAPYAGKTLILYNDGPAAFPARVPQYDYYTGAPDLTSSGGAPAIQPGYGPNTRTVMQIKVGTIVTQPTPQVTLVNLQSVFARTALKRGVFEVSQPPVIIPQTAYNSAYNANFLQNNFVRIFDQFANFTTISGTRLNITLTSKSIQDEQGEAFDEYGRAGGFLGLQTITSPGVNTLLLYGYNSPPTDVLNISMTPMSEPLPGDGTQIWKITHNGVDTHPVHWHLYNVQVINRVGWDGFIRPPHPTELGWKETVRISPLEDTIVALRPVAPTLPFTVRDSVRPIDPTSPLGTVLPGFPGGADFADPKANPVTVINHNVNLGWEYVWHCHILAHEEMDMMHAQAVAVTPPGGTPNGLVSGEVTNATTNTTAVFLAWRDQSTYESDWFIQRRNLTETNWTDLKSVPSYSTSQAGGWAMAIDSSIPPNTAPNYTYRVIAANVVGDDYAYPAPSVGFPVMRLNSTASGADSPQTIAPPGQATIGISPGSTGNATFNVTFTGASAGATGWSWDFGDGNFAGDNGKQNPSHVFQLPGNYTVRLTAMNTGGNSTSAPVNITVTKAPVPAAPVPSFINTTPREGNAPLTVTFNADASTSLPAAWATWRWTFGDGTFSSVKNPVHTYLTGGTYTVSLTATNLGGTNVMTRVGYINVTNVTPSKIAVYRNGAWIIDNNDNFAWDGVPTDTVYIFGGTGNTSVYGDWNGDGKPEVGVYNNGTWYLDYNGNGGYDGPVVDRTASFGSAGYKPVVGDWDGNGKDKIGVELNGIWAIDYNGNFV
jgi:PKD repeat protein